MASSKKLFLLIGEISISSNSIERKVRDIVETLMSEYIDQDFYEEHCDQVRCLLAGDSFDVLLKKLDNLIHFIFIHEDDIIARFERLKKTLNKFNDDRNTYIHSSFERVGRSFARTKYLRKGKPNEGKDWWLMEDSEYPFHLKPIVRINKRGKNLVSRVSKFHELVFNIMIELSST